MREAHSRQHKRLTDRLASPEMLALARNNRAHADLVGLGEGAEAL
jgi:hypothetical protein